MSILCSCWCVSTVKTEAPTTQTISVQFPDDGSYDSSNKSSAGLNVNPQRLQSFVQRAGRLMESLLDEQELDAAVDDDPGLNTAAAVRRSDSARIMTAADTARAQRCATRMTAEGLDTSVYAQLADLSQSFYLDPPAWLGPRRIVALSCSTRPADWLAVAYSSVVSDAGSITDPPHDSRGTLSAVSSRSVVCVWRLSRAMDDSVCPDL